MRSVPPCSSVSERAIARPSPEPWWLLVSWLSTCSNGRPSLASACARNADAGIDDGDAHPVLGGARAHGDAAAFGRELDRVGEKIEHDLLEQPLVRPHADALGDVGGQLDPLVVGAGRYDPHGVVEEAAEPDLLEVETDAAGLDLRHVEDVVDDVEQVLAALVDVLAVVAILVAADRAEHFRLHDLGEADDGVERRAQLVAHIGEEARLRLVGFFGAGLLVGVFLARSASSSA